jgi:serine/threonine-protein kinase HipA
MHLKNFSLLSNRHGGFGLSPAYDLLNVAIANPKDTEELALTLNGRKKRITLKDFKIAASQADIPEKVIDGMAAHFRKCLPAWEATIVNSFLSKDLQQDYLDLLHDRFERIKA